MIIFKKILAILLASAASCLALAGCRAPASPAPLTIAVTGTAHEPAPDLQVLAGRITRHAADALNPGDGKVTVIVQGRQGVTVDLTPMTGDQVDAQPVTATRKITARMPALEATATRGAATGGNDPIGVLDQGLQVTPAGGTLVLITSGLSTVSPVDLRQAGDWIGHPVAFADAISAADLPRAEGRDLVISGLGYGDPAGAQPSAGPAARTALRQIWTRICQRIGAASCTLTDGPAGTKVPVSTLKVPTVAFTPVVTHCTGKVTVSADVAFASDSAVLTKAADAQLAPVARSLAACPAGTRVDAVGHAATVPGGGDGVVLSRLRAAAVLNRLAALGAPPSAIGAATGYGNTSHQPVDNMPGGRYNEAAARRNRVVELILTTR